MANAQVFIANNDQSSILDLLDILNFDIEEWATQAASEVERDDFELDEYESALPFEPVVESLLLVADVTGDSDYDVSDLRQLAIDLQHMRRKAKEWRDDVLRSESIWWHWNTKGESEKRALIHRIEFGLPGGFMSVMKRDQILLELTVVRHPYFEPLTANVTTGISEGTISFGATQEITALGDANGRIARAIVNSSSGTKRMWAGIKPYGAGVSGFGAIWELEDGTVGTDTTSGAVAGASSSDALTCTFATDESLTERCRIKLGDVVGSNYDHNVGRFLMLLRYQAEGNGVSYHIRLNQAFNASDAVQPVSEIYIDGEASPDWHLIPLGVITVPFGAGRDGLPANAISMHYSGAMIEAARLNGSSGDDLIMDCLLPIPMDHHLSIDGLTITAGTHYGVVHTFENDTSFSYNGTGNPVTVVSSPAPASPINWTVPPEGGLLVAAVEGDTPSTGLILTLEHIPRWTLFNGD